MLRAASKLRESVDELAEIEVKKWTNAGLSCVVLTLISFLGSPAFRKHDRQPFSFIESMDVPGAHNQLWWVRHFCSVKKGTLVVKVCLMRFVA